MVIKNLIVAMTVSFVLVAACAAGVYWYPASQKIVTDAPVEKLWHAVACRARFYVDKARGRVKELSWSELWKLTLPQNGFHCTDGTSLEAGLNFGLSASDADLKSGERIFRERCTVCHGADGTGGPVGPSLTRSEYNHGDSDLAIYQVLRDGIPGTAMPSARLPLHELLQVTAHVKMLQAHVSENQKFDRPHPAIQVSNKNLQDGGADTNEWLMYSGSYNGWRHTSLAEITTANVTRLRVRWIKQFDIKDPNIEATPLVINGVMFTVVAPGDVLALDPKTGDIIWEYKRAIPSDLHVEVPVNRGLAVLGSTLFFGSLDGYLVAIRASDGRVIWEKRVTAEASDYSITGAPLVVNRSVIVGVAGGEFKIRGFLAAYDVSTGQQQWKFETIPGPGQVGHETWQNNAWMTGGGATWLTGSYDPSTDLLYWGVGNPSPAFSGDVRPGDNLFTDSVIALHASTGTLAWYFQFTPHDEHDRDAAQTPVLADVLVKGAVRKVICWTNRNGFYYVLDRITGEFLTGVPFVEVDWAKGLTPAGRPILTDVAKVSTVGRRARPGVAGGTNWQNPAFDRRRGSIFVPAIESSSVFTKSPPDGDLDGGNGFFVGSGWTEIGTAIHKVVSLDAASGKRKWEYIAPWGTNSNSNNMNYSGLLSTDGGLVFGASAGVLFALDADTGREVWRVPLGGNTRSSPISFKVDGRQVIAVAAGRSLFVFGL
jgi:alcohol dehydrogenase (cytochrome c)